MNRQRVNGNEVPLFVNDFTKSFSPIKIIYLLLLATIAILFSQTNYVRADEILQPEINLSAIVKGYSDKQPFGNPTGIFVDAARGEIFLADAGNHRVGIFDMKGTTLYTLDHWITDKESGRRVLGDPRSVVVDADGDIIISDNKADYLDILDYRGNSLQKLEPSDYDTGITFRAAALALDKAGNLYIGTQLKNPEVFKLNANYELALRFGDHGEGGEGARSISGIWIDDDGSIFVTDAFATPVLKKYSADGRYLDGFGGHSEQKIDFSFPAGVAMTRGGRIWIVDTIRQVVKCLTEDGKFVTMIGGFGVGPGDMRYPSAISSDGDTLLIVAEKNGNRFQQFVIK